MSKRSFYSLLSVAVVGVLLAILIFPLSLFAHDDPPEGHDEADHVHYPENGMGPVRDFDSEDMEDARIEWSVRGVDAADFAINSAGVLTFRESPDFENPTDRAREARDFNDNNEVDPGEAAFAAIDNDYQITVSATEVWDGVDTSLPAKRTDAAITVTVTDRDDKGELVLEWLQPEVGTVITVALTDPDAEDADEITQSVWTWYTSKVADPRGW